MDEINSVALSEDNISNAYSLFENNAITLFICSNQKIDIGLIKSKLKEKLPDYMIPTNIIQIDRLPLKTNGKIDTESLKTKLKDTALVEKVDVYAIFRIIIDDNNHKYDDEKLEMLGADSLDILKLIQMLSERIKRKKAEFSDELLKNIIRMNVSDIREFTKRWDKQC